MLTFLGVLGYLVFGVVFSITVVYYQCKLRKLRYDYEYAEQWRRHWNAVADEWRKWYKQMEPPAFG